MNLHLMACSRRFGAASYNLLCWDAATGILALRLKFTLYSTQGGDGLRVVLSRL